MKLTKKDDEIRVWNTEMLIEERILSYKFKINGKWAHDPYRRLSDDWAEVLNNCFDPFIQENHLTPT